MTQSGPKSNLGRTVRGHLDVQSLRPPKSPNWSENWTDSVSVHCESSSLSIYWYRVLWEARPWVKKRSGSQRTPGDIGVRTRRSQAVEVKTPRAGGGGGGGGVRKDSQNG